LLGGLDVNAKMVESGYAWAYERYSARYKSHQERAKRARAGFWAEPNPIPPWQWRKNRR